ncbi:MAG: DUF6526 family protein [Acidobacteriia bacterium]|nr:DUF6526 family protein [Terriglobia bacterium]
MAAQTAQTYKNHTRLDPPFHFFLLPLAGINVLVAIWYLIQNLSMKAGWFLILALAGVVAVVKIRTYALKVQDRVIRLEERLRLTQLLPEPLRGRIGELSEAQLVALRFASDAEVPSLVEKTLAGHMPQGDIKKAIVNWRPDYFRV